MKALPPASVLLASLLAVPLPAQWQKVKNAALGVAYQMPSKRLRSIPMNKGRPEPHVADKWESVKPLYGRHGAYRWSIRVYYFDAKKTPVTGKQPEEGEKPKEGEQKPLSRAEVLARLARMQRFASFEAWLDDDRRGGLKSFVKRGKAGKGQKLRNKYYEWIEPSRGINWVHMAAAYKLGEREIAIVGYYPEDKKRTIRPVVKKAINSLEALKATSTAANPKRRKVEGEKYAIVPGNPELTKQRQKALDEALRNIQGKKGWDILCTKHYIVLYSLDPKKRGKTYSFVKSLARRMDEMNKQYRKRFPPYPGMKSWWSIFRVCRSKTEFDFYGGTGGGVIGWFNPGTKELVVFNAKKLGVVKTEAVAYHEGWHQYANAYFDEATLHRWYDEGIAEYFGALKRLGPTSWKAQKNRGRAAVVKAMVSTGRFIPIHEIVRWSRAKFYGPGASNNYAQGWAIVDFLLRGQKSSSWNSSWKKILDTYATTMLKTKDATKATEAAWKGVDFEKFEAAWKSYVKKSM